MGEGRRREKRIMGGYDQTMLFTHMKSHSEPYYPVEFIYANEMSKAWEANKQTHFFKNDGCDMDLVR